MSTRVSKSQLLSDRRKKYIRVAAMSAGAGVALASGFQGMSTARGAVSNWTAAAAVGDYLDPTNWTAGVPNNASDTANFTSNNALNTTVNVTSNITLGTLNFNTFAVPSTSKTYVVTGGPASNGITLTMDNGTSNATLFFRQGNGISGTTNGTHTLALSLSLNSNLTLTGQNNNTYFVGGGTDDGYTLNLNGKSITATPISNTTVVRVANIITGNGNLTVAAGLGTISLASNGTGGGNISSFVGSVTVLTGSTLQVTGGGGNINNYGSPGYLGLGLDGTNGASLPNSSNNAASLVLDGGTFQASQVNSATTNRLFTIAATSTAGVALQAGGNAPTRLVFSNTNAVAFSGTFTAGKTLTLTGNGGSSSALVANGGESVLSPRLTDPALGFPLAVTKLGTGVWTLNNANNSYTGATLVQAGTLRLGTGAATAVQNTASLTVAPNAANNAVFDFGNNNFNVPTGGLTLAPYTGTNGLTAPYPALAGGGSITGAITIAPNGSFAAPHISPGSPIGTMTIVNAISLPNASGLDFNLDVPNSTVGGGNNDLLVLATGSSIGTGVTVNITGGASFTAGGVTGVYHLVQFASASTQDLTGWTLKGFQPSEYSFANSGNFVNLTLNNVPEPTSIGVMSVGLMGLLARRRRRGTTIDVQSA